MVEGGPDFRLLAPGVEKAFYQLPKIIICPESDWHQVVVYTIFHQETIHYLSASLSGIKAS
jgi:hypothetical protein